MSEDDDWRRRLIDARYGDSLTPGFARKTNMDAVASRRHAPPESFFAPSLGVNDRDADSMRTAPVHTLPLVAPPETRSAQTKRHGVGWVWWSGTGLLVIAVSATFGWATKSPQRQPKSHVVASIQRRPPTVGTPSTFEVSPRVLGTSGTSSPAIVAHTRPITNEPALDEPRAVKKAASSIAVAEQIERPSDLHSQTVSLPPPRSDRSKPSQAPSAQMQAQKSPSFQCHSGQGEITASICSDQTLAALDRKLAARFAALDNSVDPATVEALHHGETTFLNARQLCLNEVCLAEVYRERLRDLDAIKP